MVVETLSCTRQGPSVAASSMVPSIFTKTSFTWRAAPTIPYDSRLNLYSCSLPILNRFCSNIRVSAMDERLHRHERAGSSQHASRYDVLQPRFKQPTRPVAPRDRYRAARYEDPMYDSVEDASTDDLGSQLDSFGTCFRLTMLHPRVSNLV